MSRIARKPIQVPAGVEFKVDNQNIFVKGKKGQFNFSLHESVALEVNGHVIQVTAKKDPHPMIGTTRKILANFFQGVTEGFKTELSLIGVGYRAKSVNVQVKENGQNEARSGLELSLGFSHPVSFVAPKDVTLETPTNTSIVITGSDKQLVGETAAKIRAIRPPESYKGKGVRYSNETVIIKQTKKKK